MCRRDFANVGLEDANGLLSGLAVAVSSHSDDVEGLTWLKRFRFNGDLGVSSSLSGCGVVTTRMHGGDIVTAGLRADWTLSHCGVGSRRSGSWPSAC